MSPGGDVYFRVRSFDGYGKLSNRDPEDMDQGEEAGTAQLKEDPLDFALWKARKEDEDVAWPSPWGEGRPGLAHRVLGDGREAARHRFRDPRRRLGPDLPPPRERDRPDRGGAGGAAGADLDAQRDGPHRRGEDVEVARQHLPALRGARSLRRRGGGRLPRARATTASRSSSPSARSRTPRRAWDGSATTSPRSRPRARRTRSSPRSERRSSPRSPTTSTRPRAWAALFELVAEGNRRPLPGAHAALGELLPLLGLESLLEPEAVEADPDAERLLAERERAREPSATSSAPTRSATSSRAWVGGPRHRRAGARAGAQGCERDRLRPSPGRRGEARSPAGAPRLDDGRRRRRRADPDRGLAGPSGLRRRGRSVSLRRPARPARRPRRPPGRPRPGPGPAQPGRHLSLGGGSRGDGRGDPGAALGVDHARRSARPRRERSSTCRWRG